MEGNKQQQAVGIIMFAGPDHFGRRCAVHGDRFAVFKSFSGGGPPTRFWCAFVGLPLIALGSP